MSALSDDEHLADQFILGLLDPAEQSATEARILQDDAFADLVAATSRRFAPLDDTATPLPLSDDAWMRLEQRLESPDRRTVSTSTLRGEKTAAVNINQAPWRVPLGLVAVLLLALGLFSMVLNWPSSGQGKDAITVAVLLDQDGAPFALIEDFGGGEAAVTALVAYTVPVGKSLQAWTKWSEETGPVSLGILNAFTGSPLGADGLPQPISGQLYEITLEQKGGSATGRPTGPILGVGRGSIPG